VGSPSCDGNNNNTKTGEEKGMKKRRITLDGMTHLDKNRKRDEIAKGIFFFLEHT
jgi:hypothetical protein